MDCYQILVYLARILKGHYSCCLVVSFSRISLSSLSDGLAALMNYVLFRFLYSCLNT